MVELCQPVEPDVCQADELLQIIELEKLILNTLERGCAGLAHSAQNKCAQTLSIHERRTTNRDA